MALHIRSAETHALVREIAKRTGSTQEHAVFKAAQHYLATLSQAEDARAQHILDTGRTLGAMLDLVADDDPTADLYDDAGLPR